MTPGNPIQRQARGLHRSMGRRLRGVDIREFLVRSVREVLLDHGVSESGAEVGDLVLIADAVDQLAALERELAARHADLEELHEEAMVPGVRATHVPTSEMDVTFERLCAVRSLLASHALPERPSWGDVEDLVIELGAGLGKRDEEIVAMLEERLARS